MAQTTDEPRVHAKRSRAWPRPPVLPAAVIAAGILLLYAGLSALGAALVMRVPRLPLTATLAGTGLKYESVSFPSRVDGALLKGWLVEGSRDCAVIVVHGGFQNRVDDTVGTIDLTRDLSERGYSVVLFDLRGRGESAGRGRALCFGERDIGGALDYLQSRGYPPDRVVLLGFCSGAVSCLDNAAQQPVGALILDGCFSSVEGMISKQAAERHIPSGLLGTFMPGMRIAATVMYGFTITEPLDMMSRVRCPVFFIHEERDNLVSREETLELFSRSTNPANQVWEVPGALHSEGYRSDPAGFVTRVEAFLSNAAGLR